MPRLCLKCDGRVERGVNEDIYWCSKCGELTKDEVYKVGIRYFQKLDPVSRGKTVRDKRRKLKKIKRKQQKVLMNKRR